MKELNKEEMKIRLTDIVVQSQKLKELIDALDNDYLGTAEELNTITDDEMDSRVNRFYEYISSHAELQSLRDKFSKNISWL